MKRPLFNRRLRQLHLWLALAIGAQIGLWLISGLFMTWFSIETVRGEHLRMPDEADTLGFLYDVIPPGEAAKISGVAPEVAELRLLDDLVVWYIAGGDRKTLIDAKSGEVISPLSEEIVQSLSESVYAGRGDFRSATLLQEPPREYGRPGPVWRVEFGPRDSASFYVDATTGEVKAVRTTLWRIFDFMWGLHIMDWSTRENFNTWWIKMTASLAVLFFLSGLVLVLLRVSSMVRRRQ